MKKIKKLLSEHSAEILPDKHIKDNIKRQLGYEEKEVSLSYAHGGEKTVKENRNKLIALCASVFAVLLALCILLPVFLHKSKAPFFPAPSGNKFADITDADSFYAYGAASIGTILSSEKSATPALQKVRAMSAVVRKNSSEQIDTINKYMALVESLLSDGAITGEGIAGEMGYTYGMTVSYTDLLGDSVSYVMYYDKVFLEGETEDDETEESYSLSGILVIEDTAYPVEGSYETEFSEGETENELYFKAFTDTEKNSYIEVEQETETEEDDGESETEKEYVYSVYSKNKLIEKTEIKYEKEDDELELKMTVSKDGKKEELIFNDETEDGERVLFVRGNIDGRDVRFRIYIRQGNYHYVFENGESSDHDRFDDQDDDDD
jgi:hypothetical protein